MRQSCKNLLLMPVLLSGTVFASTMDSIPDGLYASIAYGKSITRNIKASSLPIVSTVNIVMTEPNNLGLNYKRGTNLRAAIGYKWCDARFEGELSQFRSRYKDLTMNHGENELFTPLLSGYTRARSFLGNVYYDLNQLGGWLAPYLGVGVGVARVTNHIEFELMDGKDKGTMTKNHLAYQAVGGVMINLTREFAGTVDFRHFGTSKVKALDKRLQNNSINLGVLCRF